MISGETDVPGIGTVQWVAKQKTAWGGQTLPLILLSAVGPAGELSADERRDFARAEPRFR